LAKIRSNTIAALDIGSSKISCLLAKISSDLKVQIIGSGHHVSRGIKSGAIVDMEEAIQAISNAVSAAEQISGETAHDVIVNITAGQPLSKMIYSEIQLSGHEVDDNDLKTVLDQGRTIPDLTDRTLIHSIPTDYVIDGNHGIRDPRGMFGQKLGVNIHAVTASISAIRNLANCISRCHLDITAAVLSSYASGLACLVEDEMDLGVTIIDMGGGTTKTAVFNDGNLIFSDLLPIGGSHVTSDIARGLGTPITHAERLKTLHGHAMLMSLVDNEILEVPFIGDDQYAQTGPISKSILVSIIQPRLEETFELIRTRLEASGIDHLSGRHVVLTGGASQLPGTRELASMILNKQVRIGRPMKIPGLQITESGPSSTTLVGLLVYALQNKSIYGKSIASLDKNKNKTMFSRIRKIFGKAA
jgi:cell division protein FtsA